MAKRYATILGSKENQLQVAQFGTVVGEIWRVEARFAHLEKPLIYETDGDELDGRKPEPKRDAYQQVAAWLMSENIQQILVYKNGAFHQRIVAQTPMDKEALQGWLAILEAGIGQLQAGVDVAIEINNAALINKRNTLRLLQNMAVALQACKAIGGTDVL